MKKWMAVYRGDPEEVTIRLGDLEEADLLEFDAVAASGRLDGRELAGMWIVDEAFDGAEVLRIYGRVGAAMYARHVPGRERRHGRT